MAPPNAPNGDTTAGDAALQPPASTTPATALTGGSTGTPAATVAPTAAPAAPTPSREDRASAAFQNLISAISEIRKFSREHSNIAGTIDELTELRGTLKAKEDELGKKNTEITFLEKANKKQLDEFESRYHTWSTTGAASATAIENLERGLQGAKLRTEQSEAREQELRDKELEQRRDIERLTSELDAENVKVRTLTTDLGVADTSAKFAEAQLASVRNRLGRWENYSTSLEGLDFQTLWVYFADFAFCLTDSSQQFYRHDPALRALP